ncbi:MAG: HAD family hydrolase [Proteobacteria bacterium]|nr:HAD family hydrolase [Pseudomonadota bacterium]
MVFDIDGTLLDSNSVDDDLYRSSLRHVLGPVRFREEISDYDFVSDSGILWQVLADNDLMISPDPTPEIIEYFVNALQDHISENGGFREVPGARKFFESLRSSQDHYVAIATGGWSASAILKLRSAGFDLDGLQLSASDNEHDRTAIMRSALDREKSEYESVTYYGDGPWDRDACISLGWNFVPVGREIGGLETYHNLGVV